ncbi:IS630 family transposase, partial [Candidatus Fermentibacteria bacterium]
MAYKSVQIDLTDEDRAALEQNVRSSKTEHRFYIRSKIILMAAEGTGTNEIARSLDIRPGTVSKWRVRFS